MMISVSNIYSFTVSLWFSPPPPPKKIRHSTELNVYMYTVMIH